MAPRREEAKPESFYREMWTRRAARQPRDERDRWSVIEALLVQATAELPAGGPHLLDLGCGRGWLTARLARFGEVMGIDPLESSIEMARELYPDLRFRRGCGEDLLREGLEERFHLVVSSEVVEHVPYDDQRDFLATLYRLLVPEGWAILTTPRGELWERWRAAGGRPQPVEAWLTESELSRSLEETGFRIVERRRAHPPSHPVTRSGWVDKWILGRRFVRDLPVAAARKRLGRAAMLYQVVLAQRPREGSPGRRADPSAGGPRTSDE